MKIVLFFFLLFHWFFFSLVVKTLHNSNIFILAIRYMQTLHLQKWKQIKINMFFLSCAQIYNFKMISYAKLFIESLIVIRTSNLTFPPNEVQTFFFGRSFLPPPFRFAINCFSVTDIANGTRTQQFKRNLWIVRISVL